jgi:alkaline phosphatase D
VPDSLPVNPQNIYDWRKIHKLWLLDPDLRFARQNHPFIQLWDNHDTDGLHFDCKESSEAFMNYTPVRANPLNYQKIYRQLSYGNLLDVIILDVALWRGIDTISASQDSYLGNEQFDWFKNTIRSSGARWKVVGSQKMFNNWNVVIGGGANANAWDGFPAERNRVLNVIDSNRINNVIFISGDSHVSIGADLPYMPYNNSTYNQSTGEGSLCVEFAPASISRGNFDEKGLPQALINTVLETSNQVNRHHQYADLTKHGYGILRFTEDSARAQFWYCDIQNISNLNELGKELVLINGENHWKRNAALNTSSHEMQEEQGIVVSKPYPNPAQNEVHLDIEMAQPADIQLSIYQIINPKKINFQSSSRVAVSKHSHLSLPIDHLPIGAYMLLVECGDYYKGQLFIKM